MTRHTVKAISVLTVWLGACSGTPEAPPVRSGETVIPFPPLVVGVEGGFELAVDEHLTQLYGRIVAESPITVVPTSSWHADAPGSEAEAWLLVGRGTLVCQVARPVSEPLQVLLEPELDDPASALRVSWDGTELKDALRREADLMIVDVPPSRLTVGDHRLDFDLTDTGTSLRVPRLAYRAAGVTHPLAAANHLRWNYFSDLLSRGVTGSNDREKLGGAIFTGPQELHVEIHGRSPRSFTARLQNSSRDKATFRVVHAKGAASFELEPHDKRTVDVPLPREANRLTLVAEGRSDGLYLWGAPSPAIAGEPAGTPILLVTLDTTRRDMLAAYGGDPALSPTLTRFAEEATVYEHAYATAPWTLPSHSSIFTGLYPWRHGAGSRADHLASRFDTLAEHLRRAGYFTAGFAGGPLVSFLFGVSQGFDVYRDPVSFEIRADALTDHAAQILEDFGHRNLFLFLNYFDPHFPYTPPAAVRSRLDIAASHADLPGQWPIILDGNGEAWRQAVLGNVPQTPRVLERLRASYAGEIAFLDRELGRLFSLLRRDDLYDRALIVVTADHGELLGEGGFLSHSGRLDPELVEIPLLVKWPRQEAGERIDALVSLVDLFPTMLQAAGVEAPTSDGLGLRETAELDARRAVFVEEHDTPSHPVFPNMRLGEHAWLVQSRTNRRMIWESREMAEGQACSRRVAARWIEVACGESPLTAAQIREQLGGDGEVPEARIHLSKKEQETLRALGYL